jgi:hypothetical protein
MKFAAIIATIASMAAFAMAAPVAKEGTYTALDQLGHLFSNYQYTANPTLQR